MHPARKLKLIVGIDYGTTYSGLSFALSNATDIRDIFPWTKYPGAFTHCAEHNVKAPTKVAYASENKDLDGNAWGYQVEPGFVCYSWTKLLLDEATVKSEYDDPDLYEPSSSAIARIQLPGNKSATEVATEYLRGMHGMFDRAIRERFGAHDVETMPVEFWLTVPASWSEKAKLLTKKAAQDAGFGKRSIDKIRLIPEPEAAAHIALKSSLRHVTDFVKDLASYEITATQPKLKLREIAVGIAGKCGSTSVDRNFHKMLVKRFGAAFTSLPTEMTGPGSHFMNQFEQKKKDFSAASPSRRQHRFFLRMPLLPQGAVTDWYYERRTSSVLLSHADYKALFDPVVDAVVRLVERQIADVDGAGETAIETVVLVGGFGCSPYLKERLAEWCAPKGIRLATPMTGGWSAVVCGAVMRGLQGCMVQQKKCRKAYGFELSERYVHALHKNYDRSKRQVWTDYFTGDKYLHGFMVWQTHKGQTLDSKSEMNYFFEQYASNRLPTSGTCDVLSCGLDDAPFTIEGPGIEKIGCVHYSLDDLDLVQVPRTWARNRWHYKIPLSLNIKLGDEVGHLVFRIMFDGREVGKASIDISKD